MIRNQQRDDCGVCAVANVLGVGWWQAAEIIFGDAYYNKLKFNTKTKQIARSIDWPADPQEYKLIRVKLWHDIPNLSIVKVIPKELEGTGNWHWVCWRDGKVWDSMERGPRPPEKYTACRLVSYLGVVHE